MDVPQFSLLHGPIYHHAFYKLVYLNSHRASVSFDLYNTGLIYGSLQ